MKPKTFARVELGRLTDNLRLCLRNDTVCGYQRGKRRLQELIARLYSCSPPAAGHLVEHLERDGYVVAVGPQETERRHPREVRWRFCPTPTDRA